MAQPIAFESTPQDGDFLSSNLDIGDVMDDFSSYAKLEERDVKPLYEWDEKHRTVNGRQRLVGTVACYKATVDEQTYYVQHAEPFSDVDPVGRVINKTPAFITQDDQGINLDMTAIAVEAGFYVTIVSQEAGWQKCPSLAKSAFNHIAIADKIRQEKIENGYDKIPGIIEDEEGVSRGCIFLMKKTQLRRVFGRKTGNVEGFVPVYHHNNSLAKDVFLYGSLPFKESKGIAKIIRNDPRSVKMLGKTVISDPWEIFHALRSINTLRGSQNKYALRQFDPNQKGTFTIAGLDSFGQTGELLNELEAFENIEVRHVKDGYHVSFMDPAEMRAYKERTFKRADEIRDYNLAA